MTIHYRNRSDIPRDVLITSVHCVICRRFAKTGEYTIAPEASIHAGKPICAACIDLVPPATHSGGLGVLGPSETKGR